MNLHIHSLRQGVHSRNSYAVQPSGETIARAVVELSACVQRREDHFHCGLSVLFQHVGGYASAVVGDFARAVAVESHIYAVAVAHRGFVHSIVDHFPDQLMQTCRAGVADVHSGAFADRLQPFQNLYLVSPVAVAV